MDERNKQGLNTPQVRPHSQPSDSFNMGEPFHPCEVLGGPFRNWKIDSRPLKLTLFLPPALAFSARYLFLTYVLFFLRDHEGSYARKDWSESDLYETPSLPTH